MCVQCGANDGMDACQECWNAHFGTECEHVAYSDINGHVVCDSCGERLGVSIEQEQN